MLTWISIMIVVALVAGAIRFAGASSAASDVAWLLFGLAVVVSLVLAILSPGDGPAAALLL